MRIQVMQLTYGSKPELIHGGGIASKEIVMDKKPEINTEWIVAKPPREQLQLETTFDQQQLWRVAL